MKVKKVIEKMYPQFNDYVKRFPDKCFNGRTTEDTLNDVMLMALRKFGDGDYEEEELVSYLKLNLVREIDCLQRKANKCEIKIGDNARISKRREESEE